MNEAQTRFSLWLRMRMTEMNIGVRDMATYCDTDISTVSCWRWGKQTPSIRFVPKLAKRLCVKETTVKRKLGLA